jgi:hypothetical protein
MIGYQLVERATLVPEDPNGILALPNAIGLLDFLRELAAEELPFPRLSEWRMVGLEEVLYATRPDDMALALDIRRRLVAAASDLERRLVSVQVVFQETLRRGDILWVEYRGQRLQLGHIFGAPLPQSDARGNRFFHTSFSLTGA